MPIGIFQTVLMEVGKNLLQEGATIVLKSIYESGKDQRLLDEMKKKSYKPSGYYFKVDKDGVAVKTPMH